jgi:hypothetical protein
LTVSTMHLMTSLTIARLQMTVQEPPRPLNGILVAPWLKERLYWRYSCAAMPCTACNAIHLIESTPSLIIAQLTSNSSRLSGYGGQLATHAQWDRRLTARWTCRQNKRHKLHVASSSHTSQVVIRMCFLVINQKPRNLVTKSKSASQPLRHAVCCVYGRPETSALSLSQEYLIQCSKNHVT